MPLMKLLLALLFLSAGCSYGAGVEREGCSKEQALVAENYVLRIGDWSGLEQFFEEYRSCDDGLIAEGISDRVGFLLESDLDGFITIARLAQKREFRRFVINHLDEILNEDTVRSIFLLTKSCSESEEICQELMARAESTLTALSSP